MSFKNCWTISSTYDFQAHQQCPQRRCCFSQTALQWFEVLPGFLSALPVLSPALPGAPRCTWRPLHWSSQLWDLTTLEFWSDNSETLLETPSDIITFCWCIFLRKLVLQHNLVFIPTLLWQMRLWSDPTIPDWLMWLWQVWLGHSLWQSQLSKYTLI